MSKRPSIGPETVVRKSRLAAKGEAVPASDHHHLGPPLEPQATVAAPPEVPPIPEKAAASLPTEIGVVTEASIQPRIDELLAELSERDRRLEVVHSALLWSEQERAAAVLDGDRSRAELAAANASVEALREQIVEINPGHLRSEVLRLEQERAAAVLDGDRLRAALAAANASVESLREQIVEINPGHLRSEVLRLEEERAAAVLDGDRLRAALAAANASIEALREQIAEINPGHLRSEVLRLEEERAAAVLDGDGLRAALAAANASVEALREQIGEINPGHLRSEVLRLERERLQERAAAAREFDQVSGNLSAADATIDELRNRVGDLRSQLEVARAEVLRLIEQHSAERQRLLDYHRGESERLLQVAVVGKGSPAGGVMAAVRRWLFGHSPAVKPSTLSHQKPVPAKPVAAAARPTVAKPVGPPTAPKVLNRRSVS